MAKRQGAILSCGRAATAAAAAYASLCKKDHVALADYGECLAWIREQSSYSSSTIFVREEGFTLAFLSEVVQVARARSFPLGFVPIPGEAAAAVQLANRLGARSLRERVYAHKTLSFSDVIAGQHTLAPIVSGFGRRGAGEFLELLEEGAEALLLHSHSNGADIRIGRNVLCSQADHLRPAPPGPGERSLPCQAGGMCQRQAMMPTRFVGAGEVPSRVVVMITCGAIHAAGGLIDPRFTFASALLRGEHVEAVVGSFIVRTAPLEWLSTATQFLREGGTAGELALCLNLQVRDFPGYVCLGDPDVRLHEHAKSQGDPGRSDVAAVGPQDADVVASRQTQIDMLQAIERDDGPEAERAREVRWKLARTEAPSYPTSELNKDIAELFGRLLGRGWFLFKLWQDAADFTDYTLAGATHGCGASLMVARATINAGPTPSKRCLWACTRCGSVGDTPAGWQLPPLVASDESAQLDLTHLPSGAEGWLFSTVEGIGFCPEVSGSLRELIRREVVLPVATQWAMAGLRWFAVAIVVGEEFAVVRVPLRESVQ